VVPSKAPSSFSIVVPSEAPSRIALRNCSLAPYKALCPAANSYAPSPVPRLVPTEAPVTASAVPSALPSVVPSSAPSMVQSDAPSVVPPEAPSVYEHRTPPGLVSSLCPNAPSGMELPPPQVPAGLTIAVPSIVPSSVASPPGFPRAVPSGAPAPARGPENCARDSQNCSRDPPPRDTLDDLVDETVANFKASSSWVDFVHKSRAPQSDFHPDVGRLPHRAAHLLDMFLVSVCPAHLCPRSQHLGQGSRNAMLFGEDPTNRHAIMSTSSAKNMLI
jgi:hypothetical protein